MTALEKDTVSKGLQMAEKVLAELKPVLDQLNVLYDTTTIGFKYTIDQAGLDGVQSYQGLTKAQLDDGMYALTAVLKPAIDTAFIALAHCAARA